MRYVSIFWSHFTWPNTTLSHELSSWHPLWKDSLTFPHHHSYIFCSKLPRCILTMISSWGEIIEKLRNYTVGPRISEGELSLVHGSQHPTLTGFDGKCLIKWLFFKSRGGWQQLHVNWTELASHWQQVGAQELKSSLRDFYESKCTKRKESNIGRNTA